jgi:hypothetical protein
VSKARLSVMLVVLLLASLVACGEEEAEEEQQAAEQVEEVEEEEVEVVDPEMTEEEMVAWVMENCICPQCPSWIPEAAEKGEGGYCAVGISECIVDEMGCVCPECPVTLEKGLQWGYYCTRGSAEELMAQEQ